MNNRFCQGITDKKIRKNRAVGEKFMKPLKLLILLLKGKVRYVLKLLLHF